MKKIFLFSFWLIAYCLLPTVSFAQIWSGSGGSQAFAFCSDSTIMAWGQNIWGKLGDGTNINRPTPITLSITNVKSVATGAHTLFLKNDGTVWGSGRNASGEIGIGVIGEIWTPVQTNITNVIAIAVGGYEHSLFLKNDGTIWACGNNNYGQLGIGTNIGPDTCWGLSCSTMPMQVQNLAGIIDIAAGHNHSLALKNDGTVWAWGYNCCGQVGDSTYSNYKVSPMQVWNLTNIIAIGAGADFSFAIKNDGTVWGWGNNSYGHLGDGTSFNTRIIPVQTEMSFKSISALYGGQYHGIATDGNVWAWGRNESGEVGIGNNIQQDSPVMNGLSPTIVKVAAAGFSSYALKNDSTLWAWGRNTEAALGIGDTLDRWTPVQVIGLCPVMLPVQEIKSPFDVAIYPNPSTGIFTITPTQKISEIEITNLIGQKIYPFNSNHFSLPSGGSGWALNLSSQPNGIYFLHLQTEKRTANKKIIINK